LTSPGVIIWPQDEDEPIGWDGTNEIGVGDGDAPGCWDRADGVGVGGKERLSNMAGWCEDDATNGAAGGWEPEAGLEAEARPGLRERCRISVGGDLNLVL
jgi:hypothetical protein